MTTKDVRNTGINTSPIENFARIVNQIRSERKLIFEITLGALILGLIVALSTPREYTSTVKMAPEAQTNMLYSNMSDLAAIAGIDIGNENKEGLNLLLYPDVARSVPFLVGMLNMDITDIKSGKCYSLYYYLSSKIKKQWWKEVIQAPSRFVELIRFGKSDNSGKTLDPYHLTKKQDEVVNILNDRIYINVDKKTGIITAGVTLQDPEFAAETADTLVTRLERYIIDYRTNKSRQDFNYATEMFEKAKKDYYLAQQNYADYVDRNKNIILESVVIEQDRLKNQVNLTYNVYLKLAEQVENAKLKVQEKTPCFTIIEPSRIPVNKSNTGRLTILLSYGLVGLILGILFTTNSEWFKSLFNLVKGSLKQNEP